MYSSNVMMMMIITIAIVAEEKGASVVLRLQRECCFRQLMVLVLFSCVALRLDSISFSLPIERRDCRD